MSQTVTIPVGFHPLEITINNTKYVYREGETVDVPDEVAALVEQYMAAQPTPKPNSLIDNLGLAFQRSDKGKAFKVKDDGTDVEWGEVSPSGGGSGLPEVTAADMGKVLTVVNPTEDVIVPEQAVSMESPGASVALSGANMDLFVAGQGVVVYATFNGVKQEFHTTIWDDDGLYLEFNDNYGVWIFDLSIPFSLWLDAYVGATVLPTTIAIYAEGYDEDAVGWAPAEPSGGALVVHGTWTEVDGEPYCTLDKTAGEILTAYRAGANIVIDASRARSVECYTVISAGENGVNGNYIFYTMLSNGGMSFYASSPDAYPTTRMKNT